jgi:hypothetical protein
MPAKKLRKHCFQERTYTMGDNQNAADYATQVINSGEFSLATADEYPADVCAMP